MQMLFFVQEGEGHMIPYRHHYRQYVAQSPHRDATQHKAHAWAADATKVEHTAQKLSDEHRPQNLKSRSYEIRSRNLPN